MRERVSQAISETLAEVPEVQFDEPPPAADRIAGSIASSESSLDLVRAGDRVGYIEGARSLIRGAQKLHREAAEANSSVIPSEDVLKGLAEQRDSSADALAAWFAPALEYEPAFLTRPLRDLSEAFGESLLAASGQSFSFWNSIHQGWIALTLKASVAIAVWRELPDAIKALLATDTPSAAFERDEAPLMLNPSFTWNQGYLGDARVAFDDFLRFASTSETLGQFATSEDNRMSLVCGADLTLGLARWILETNDQADRSLSPFRSPYAYAGFAAYYCGRIGRVARSLERSAELAEALGAPSLDEFKRMARAGFGPLSHAIEGGRRHTCDSWEEAIQRR